MDIKEEIIVATVVLCLTFPVGDGQCHSFQFYETKLEGGDNWA